MEKEKLTTIKTKAQELLAEEESAMVLNFLLAKLKDVDPHLHNHALLLKSNQSALFRHKEEKLITTDEFIVSQNRLTRTLSAFILDLDAEQPEKRMSYFSSLSASSSMESLEPLNQTMKKILRVLFLILIEGAILIYLALQ